MPPPAIPSRKLSETNINSEEPPSALLDSLQGLCKLSRSELEKLVTEVVNDESFPELVIQQYFISANKTNSDKSQLEHLDGLWRVKGALERRA